MNECLVHHGVKGQRWGVRQDRNTDNAGKAKKILKVSAYIAGTLALSYAGLKISTSPAARKVASDFISTVGKTRVKDIDWDNLGPEIIPL